MPLRKSARTKTRSKKQATTEIAENEEHSDTIAKINKETKATKTTNKSGKKGKKSTERIIPSQGDLKAASSSNEEIQQQSEIQQNQGATADFNEDNEFINMRVNSNEDQFVSDDSSPSEDDTDSVKLMISKKQLEKLRFRAGDQSESSRIEI